MHACAYVIISMYVRRIIHICAFLKEIEPHRILVKYPNCISSVQKYLS